MPPERILLSSCTHTRTPCIHTEILSRTHTSLPSQGMMRPTHTRDLGGLFSFYFYFKLSLSSPFLSLEFSLVYALVEKRPYRSAVLIYVEKIGVYMVSRKITNAFTKSRTVDFFTTFSFYDYSCEGSKTELV